VPAGAARRLVEPASYAAGVLVDSHCHARRYWPYEPPVPDPETRPAVEQLLFEMDRCGVD